MKADLNPHPHHHQLCALNLLDLEASGDLESKAYLCSGQVSQFSLSESFVLRVTDTWLNGSFPPYAMVPYKQGEHRSQFSNGGPSFPSSIINSIPFT